MEGESQELCCNVIYYCTSSKHGITALYQQHTPPPLSTETADEDEKLEAIYHNARVLLDVDQGGFHEVYISSSEHDCLERLDIYANRSPTVVLVEVSEIDDEKIAEEHNGTAFLHKLNTNIQGARYQKEVSPFALLKRTSTQQSPEASTTARLLQAGAEEIIQSPLSQRGINQLVGHVMERTRPPAHLVGSAMAQSLINSIKEQNTYDQPCYRPDQALNSERLAFVEHAVLLWAFPAHDLDLDELTYATILMLEHVLRDDEMKQYRISREELVAFVLATRRQYKHEREVHYHNWRHAVDVTQSIYQFLTAVGLCPPADPREASKKIRSSVEMLITPLDGLMLLVSAIGHDVGHPGVNNAFLVACNHPLAQLYNDKSVLENYHCAAYSQLLRRHWPSLSKCAIFRQTLISNILSTDMQRHFEYMSHLTELRHKLMESNMSVEAWNGKDKDHARELMMALMMKAADISNIARPFEISAAWAKVLINEFASQGDLESELGIPTCLFGGPPDKDDQLAAAQSQKGFMNLFGFPLFQGLSDILPSISCSIDTLENNQRRWDEKIAAETDRRKNHDSGHATLPSLGTKHDVEVLHRHRQSEPNVVPVSRDSPPSTPIKWRAGQTQSGSPIRHPNMDERKRYIVGFTSRDDGKRASAPMIGPNTLLNAPGNSASRRSSKDVALDQLHQLNLFSHPATIPSQPGSRSGSAEAIYQLEHNPSRRGSKDESLTTILVTQQSGHASTSPTRANKSQPTHSHATSSGTATTGGTHHSLSTQPSSITQTHDYDGSPSARPMSSTQSANNDPFVAASTASSRAASTTTTTPPPDTHSSKSFVLKSRSKGDSSPRVMSRMTSGDSSNENNAGQSTPRKSDGQLQQSRSRSRLRSLKFWTKKRKDSISAAMDSEAGNEHTSSSP